MTTTTGAKPYLYVCEKCGSSDVRVDAYASWNPHTKQWELAELFDEEVCMSCGGSTNLVEKDLE